MALLSEREKFLRNFAEWKTERERINAMEESGDPFPSPDEWAWSDDGGIDLLYEAVALLEGET